MSTGPVVLIVSPDGTILDAHKCILVNCNETLSEFIHEDLSDQERYEWILDCSLTESLNYTFIYNQGVPDDAA